MGKGVLCITLVSAIPQVKISSPVVLTRCTQSIFTRELVAREGPGGGGVSRSVSVLQGAAGTKSIKQT